MTAGLVENQSGCGMLDENGVDYQFDPLVFGVRIAGSADCSPQISRYHHHTTQYPTYSSDAHQQAQNWRRCQWYRDPVAEYVRHYVLPIEV